MATGEPKEYYERLIHTIPAKRPHTCPVCAGKGEVPQGFYRAIGTDTWSASTTQPDNCRTCNGSGVVWG